MKFSAYRIFIITLILTILVVLGKIIFSMFGWEPIVLGSLHGSAISGAIFVIGFILSATISDYKEAERIPAEIASTIEDMNEDVMTIYQNYSNFDLAGYQAQLEKVAKTLAGDLRNSKSNKAKTQLYVLGTLHAAMEKSGVPANFIVKLKQQQAALVRYLFRVNYIQRITFIPSATILAYSIVCITIALLLLTEVDTFIGGLALTAVITFIMSYVLQLINVIKTPFHDEGKTRDDVSLFLIERTVEHLRSGQKR
jgi:hypothetical protein